jgi:hypothetical protein
VGLFGRKDERPPTSYEPEMPPSLSDADLADAARLMDQWDASLGNSDATWNCVEMIARRGGFKGVRETATEIASAGGKYIPHILQRPWRWWNEAARLAHANGDDVLAGRIFLFTQLFVNQIVPRMNTGDMMDTGLEPPAEETSRSIATIAVGSLRRLSPDLLIHDTATGKVNVADTLRLAEYVSGAPDSSTALGG